MEKDIYGVFGTGGFAREVMPLVQAYVSSSLIDTYEAVFVTDIDIAEGLEQINEAKVISFDDFCKIKSRRKFLTIALADSLIRRKIAKKLLRLV